MSQQEMQNFIAEANRKPELFSGLVDAVGDREGADAFEAVSDYATSQGYTVTPGDAEAARSALLDAAQGDGELNDTVLENTAGGSMIYMMPGATDGVTSMLDGVVKTGETIFSWIKKW